MWHTYILFDFVQLLQDNKIPLQLAYQCDHGDIVNYLAKKAADIDPILINQVLFKFVL